ncbi:feruloyl-CoA synthase [Loktanella sp. M215]|uniref:feruloyl-CoA synthase n=1 Tax=Loktanella sp. M215 TaxID=2675431 RepID=UPI003019D458
MSGHDGKVALWQPELRMRRQADGSILIDRLDPLGCVPDRLTDRIAHWAQAAPNRTWMAQRDQTGAWRRVSYAALFDHVKALGQWLLDAGLSVDRPLAILSENSLEHAILALSAQYVGIPSAAIAPAYALIAEDYGKLSSVMAQITPGAVLVDDASAYSPALRGAVAPDVPVIALRGQADSHRVTAWADALHTTPTDAVSRAHRAIGPDTVAKFLFTSGTTGNPKAVTQTNRMLCANMVQVADCFAYMTEEPPVFVDWAPWNHTASGNKTFNMALWFGGTFYIDEGKPSPGGIKATIRNLSEVSPTWYFNVPVGYEALVAAMQTDTALRDTFFADLKLMMYAGAGMASHTWRALEELAVAATGHRVLMTTGLGATETGPFSLFCATPQDGPGNIGVPARGLTLKLVPYGDRFEARLKGPNITPGYWRNPALTAEAFDADGFYHLGDALRFVDPDDPAAGFRFDGRIAENFKLRTGTWVAVGPLRAQLLDQCNGLIRDAVIVGEDRDALAALLIPDLAGMRRLATPGTADADLSADDNVRQSLIACLTDHAQRATGSASRITRAMVLTTPLSLAAGEVTDKGSVNQRAVLRHRADLVRAVYDDRPDVLRPA